jgi:WD40 repeat protein
MVFNAQSWQLLKSIRCQSERINSLIFSSNGALLASGSSAFYNSSDDVGIQFWDVASWQCLQTLEGYGSRIRKLDVAKSFFQTERGMFTLHSPTDPACSGTDPERLSARGFGVSKDRAWITWNSANLLKLPSDYVMSAFAVAESSIGIGYASGHIILLDAASHSPLQEADRGRGR